MPIERLRVPPPLMRRRLPSGRGATTQPNVTGDGDARLTGKFWVLVVLTGVATGLFGVLMMLILFSVQHLAFGTPLSGEGTLSSVEAASGWHRLLPVLIGGVVAGPAWFLLRKFTPGAKSEVDDVLWTGVGRLSFRRSLGTSVISEVVIGLGASLGREAAPKLMGAVSGNVLAEWARLTPAQRRLLVACGGGAGLAAVYNVPLGGALFTAEILVGAINLPTMLPAVVCSAVATSTAWIFLPQHPTYVDIPQYAFALRLLVWALVAGVVIGLASAGYVRLIGHVSHLQATGRRALIAPLIAFAILGLLALAYPQLYGNGKGMAHDAFLGSGTLTLLLALAVLKPAVTLLCLGSGASGGLFTPVMSTGAVAGGFLGLAWNHLWPGSPVGAYAIIGAAAMIGASMQAPLAAVTLILELTHSGFALMVPILIATALATAVTRWIDGYSIYTARLAPEPLSG
ncbi:chloride channel protein [Allobranchiibius sp. GilTou73]|uniref:chloride channel protein n=1 Tax=Allobranchiibius sp. GilTou73 TaxID=2904523 RepID=UPI001F30F6C6|nr:chloride channel protein [Allobranchiibius sp. GilTou73]UIJ33743.1 chloride channel protein [Allobranchiibius sp. GilTou73]